MSCSWSILRLFACATLVLLHGCASTQDNSASEATMSGWWYASFRINPSKSEIQWHLDALLANEVVAPILEEYAEDIPIWRFHRRAADDVAGHQFSFIYYASPRTAAVINQKLQGNELYSKLRKQGLVQQLFVDNTHRVLRPEMTATSDKKWSVPLQESWPHYIMGVSRIWLGLIKQYSVGQDQSTILSELVEKYKDVNRRVTLVWRKQGRHAFLHHLNALFGYQPLEMTKHRLINF